MVEEIKREINNYFVATEDDFLKYENSKVTVYQSRNVIYY